MSYTVALEPSILFTKCCKKSSPYRTKLLYDIQSIVLVVFKRVNFHFDEPGKLSAIVFLVADRAMDRIESYSGKIGKLSRTFRYDHRQLIFIPCHHHVQCHYYSPQLRQFEHFGFCVCIAYTAEAFGSVYRFRTQPGTMSRQPCQPGWH